MTVHPEIISKIWVPDLFFSNEKEARFHAMITNNTLLRRGSILKKWVTFFCIFGEKVKTLCQSNVSIPHSLRISDRGDVYVSIRLSLVLACHMPLHRYTPSLLTWFISAYFGPTDILSKSWLTSRLKCDTKIHIEPIYKIIKVCGELLFKSQQNSGFQWTFKCVACVPSRMVTIWMMSSLPGQLKSRLIWQRI